MAEKVKATRVRDRDPITAEELRSLLVYDPETGVFTAKVSITRNRRAGEIVGYVAASGYIVISRRGKNYMGHRLAWLYVYGEWPRGVIDHINHDITDNRIANLRDVTRAENNCNRISPASHNSLGVLGVRRNLHRFTAKLSVGGKEIHLGSFETKETAHQAYMSAKLAAGHIAEDPLPPREIKKSAEKFSIGDYVVPSDKAIEMGKNRPVKGGVHGIVTGFHRNPEMIFIKCKHLKTACSYHIDYWQKAR